jgi:hypothetical protein
MHFSLNIYGLEDSVCDKVCTGPRLILALQGALRTATLRSDQPTGTYYH